MELDTMKTTECKVILNALNYKWSAEQLKWMVGVLVRRKIAILSTEAAFDSRAKLPLQTTFHLEATFEQALLLSWMLADVCFRPEHRAEGKVDPDTGEPVKRNAAIHLDYKIYFKGQEQNAYLEQAASRSKDE